MRKKHILMLAVITVGIVGCLLMEKSERDSKIDNDGIIQRNEYGQGDYYATLVATSDEYSKKYDICVSERKYSSEELENLSCELKEKLPLMILGENESLDRVNKDLLLLRNAENYPFSIVWKISDEKLMNPAGELLCPMDCNEEHEVTLTATLLYEDFRDTKQIIARIVPIDLTKEERFALQLDRNVNVVLDDETSKYINLPKEIAGREIDWGVSRQHGGIVFLVVSFVAAVILSYAYDYDQKTKAKERIEKMALLYPEFVEKLKMYILSGLTMRSSLEAIARNTDEDGKNHNPFTDELDRAINKLSNGVREEKVYEELGNRCGGPYRRLFFLLNVNLRKGNDRLIQMLTEENIKALEMRKDTALRKSDEAGIKLLFPMTLMLLIVMVVIMIPAYLGITI